MHDGEILRKIMVIGLDLHLQPKIDIMQHGVLGLISTGKHHNVLKFVHDNQQSNYRSFACFKACMGNLRPAGQIQSAKASHPACQ